MDFIEIMNWGFIKLDLMKLLGVKGLCKIIRER